MNSNSSLTTAEKVLKESLSPPEFRDIHLYAFSRRTVFPDGSHGIDLPLAISAIGSILEDTDYFARLLTSGFAESNASSPETIRQQATIDEYDYDSDSDLDEFECDTIPSDVASSSTVQAKGKIKSDSDDSEDAKLASSSNVIRHILIPNVAYRTLKACIFYLYTGKINFLPFKSNGNATRQFALLTTNSNAPPCSPKSMYRLAEAYNITALQKLAFDDIVSQISAENIVEEAFSSFFSRYDQLREQVVSFLGRNFSHRAVQSSFPMAIKKIVAGELPHSGDALQSLFGLRLTMVDGGTPIITRPSSSLEDYEPTSQ